MDTIHHMIAGIPGLIKRTIQNDDFKFRIKTSLEIILIPLMSFTFMAIFIWFTLKINLIYLKANGYAKIDILEAVYYDYFLSTSLEIIPYIVIFLIINFLIGNYIGTLLLRPFKIISAYCEKKLNNEEAVYDPDFFTDLKRLTSFSEYFFNMLDTAEMNEGVKKIKVPVKFTKIHKPGFEYSFFIQYFLILILNSGIVAAVIYLTTTNIHSDLVKLSIETISLDQSSRYFLNQQGDVFNVILWGVMFFHFLLTILLSLYFYSKVSGPAFGIFATMRSFLKGNHTSRVHLIGYYYVRPYCRVLNQYLDKTQKNFEETAE